MATEERLPPACAFALSVLAERDLDPEAVPEEAVEAAQQHMATCPRCVNASANPSSSTTGAAPRKKKKVRRVAEASDYYTGAGQSAAPLLLDAAPPSATEQEPEGRIPSSAPAEASSLAVGPAIASSAATGIIDCQQCREMLPEYAEAMDSGQKVALLYPEVQEHLLTCESGCWKCSGRKRKPRASIAGVRCAILSARWAGR